MQICARHGIWQSDGGQPHLELAGCPEIIAAQHRAIRLLRRFTPQQLILAHLTAASEISQQPVSAPSSPPHWTQRLRVLRAANQHLTAPSDLDTLTEAAIYPDAIALAATAPA
jgi:hypothetical protein